MSDYDYENVQTSGSIHGNTGHEMDGAPRSSFSRSAGVLTYSVGGNAEAEVPATQYRSNAIQAGLGGVTTSMNGQTHTEGAVTNFSTAELTGGQTGFLASARNEMGFSARGVLTPSTIVEYGGMEVALETLESMGVVRKTATGSYEEVNAGDGDPQKAPQDAPKNALTDGITLFNPAVEAQVAEAIESCPQAFYDGAIAKVLDGGVEALNINELAFQSGITPQEAQQRVQVVMNAFTAQADGIAKAAGIGSPDEFYDWAAQERSEEFSNARNMLAYGRNTKALEALTADFFRSNPPSIDALTKAGIPVRAGIGGEPVCFLRGTWVSPKAAALSGWI